MKAVRVLLVGVGILAVLVLIALGLALNSSVQTWAARKALASQPALHATIGTVDAGFSSVALRDVHLESNGAVLTLPSLQLEMPLPAAGLSKRVTVRRLVAKGWTLDVTHAVKLAATLAPLFEHALAVAPGRSDFSLLSSAYAADAKAAVFRGIFADLQLPVDLAVDGVELDGEVILPPLPGSETARLRVTLSGGGLAAGREGSFIVDLAGAKSSGGALTLHGTLAAAMDTPRTFNRFGAKIAAEASGKDLPAGVKLNIDAVASRAASGESYSVLLSGEQKQLAALKADLTASTSQIVGTWKLDVRDGDLTPFAMGRALPVFTAVGEGSFETTTAIESIHATGHLAASADQLNRVREELAAMGAMNLTADFDVLHHGDSLRVEKLDATLAGAAPVLRVNALQSFEFNLKTAALQVADPARDLVGLSLAGVPLAWARPFLGDLAITGGDVRGEFVASAREGGLALRPKAPLTLSKVSVTRAGTPLLRDVDLSLAAAADYTPQGWQLQLTEVKAAHAGTTLLTLNGKAGQLAGADKAVKITGQWSANLAALMSQPVVASQLQITAGAAEGDFAGSMDGTKSIETKLSLSKLAVATGEKIPAITFQLRADVAADGKITFKAPLLFDQAGRKSDLLVAGTLTPGATSSTIDARITGDQVITEDVQVLLVLLPSEPSTPAPTKTTSPDSVALWSAVNGQATLALKKVVYGGTFEVTDVNGTLRLDPEALKLEGVRAMFGPESDLKLGSTVKFDAKVKDRYAVEGNLAVNNFDTAPAFRALDPTKSPTIESRVTLTTHFTGAGPNLNEAAERMRGDVQVTGKSGVFRALSADLSNQVQKTQSTVAAIGGLIGGLTGKKEYSDYANKTQILSDIAKALAEIPFDQLNVTAMRGDDLNLVLKDFTLISPEVRLTGGGDIKHVEGTALLQQPLSVQLNLGARGKLADLLKRAGLLEAKQDNLGYAAFITPIKVAGTLAKTDTSELKKTLLNSALEKSGLLDSLLGK